MEIARSVSLSGRSWEAPSSVINKQMIRQPMKMVVTLVWVSSESKAVWPFTKWDLISPPTVCLGKLSQSATRSLVSILNGRRDRATSILGMCPKDQNQRHLPTAQSIKKNNCGSVAQLSFLSWYSNLHQTTLNMSFKHNDLNYALLWWVFIFLIRIYYDNFLGHGI